MEKEINSKRREFYKAELAKSPFNYDYWFDLARLEEQALNNDKAREVYAQAVLKVPPTKVKGDWKRYIYLWLNWATFEELQN